MVIKMESVGEVNYLRFAAARAKEMAVMEHFMNSKNGRHLVSQQLPRHMRRRAASHNAKRVPRRLRERYKKQLEKDGTHGKSKKPSRRHRRRPSNLLQEYSRRQRQNVWLETHIWHAKRFRMINKWGCRLPYKCNDKGYRATSRAVKSNCIIMDRSYLCVMELQGQNDVLMNQLDRITSEKTGLTFKAKMFTEGKREGSCFLYHPHQYPNKPIGPVTFIWKAGTTNDSRILWISCHPSIKSIIIDVLITIFDLHENPDMTDNISSCKTSVRPTASYSSPEVKLVILDNALNRFRLLGPASISVLQKCLKLDVHPERRGIKRTQDGSEITPKKDFIHGIFSVLNEVTSLSDVSIAKIFSYPVLDPRLFQSNLQSEAILRDAVVDESCGSIWDAEYRHSIAKRKASASEWTTARSKSVEEAQSLLLTNRIPILLIHVPGIHNETCLGFGEGFDVILPGGWGSEFWNCLVHHGASARGLVDEASVSLYQRRLLFPEDYPDTSAGQREQQRCREERQREYFRKPPNKRCNFIKLAIASPFGCPWSELVRYWEQSQSFCVLRDKKLITHLLEAKLKWDSNVRQLFPKEISYLVPVSVTLMAKGTINSCALIGLPNSEDLSVFDKKEIREPIEPDHTDSKVEYRKMLKIKHIKRLKGFKKIRLEQKKSDAPDEKVLKEAEEGWKNEIKEYEASMRKSWTLCSRYVAEGTARQTIGFINRGDSVLTEGVSAGLGFCALTALLNLLELTQNKDTLVLIRNTNSNQYRYGWLDVLSE